MYGVGYRENKESIGAGEAGKWGQLKGRPHSLSKARGEGWRQSLCCIWPGWLRGRKPVSRVGTGPAAGI